jgi:hypothetical protein
MKPNNKSPQGIRTKTRIDMLKRRGRRRIMTDHQITTLAESWAAYKLLYPNVKESWLFERWADSKHLAGEDLEVVRRFIFGEGGKS